MIRTQRQKKRARIRNRRRKIGIGSRQLIYRDDFSFGLGPEWVTDSGVTPTVSAGLLRFENVCTLRNTKLVFANSGNFDVTVGYEKANWGGDVEEELFDFDNLLGGSDRDSIGFSGESSGSVYTLKAFKIIDGSQTDIATLSNVVKGAPITLRLRRVNGIAMWFYTISPGIQTLLATDDVSGINSTFSFRFVFNNTGAADPTNVDYVWRTL